MIDIQHPADHIIEESVETGWCDHCNKRDVKVTVRYYNDESMSSLCKSCEDN